MKNAAYDLSRFTTAHAEDFKTALQEIKAGRKTSHWMWYIFPQINGLARSSLSEYYSIKSLDEAKQFLSDGYLGANLREICRALLELNSDNAYEVFGSPDDLKLRSSMTLFAVAAPDEDIFLKVLEKYCGGCKDVMTLQILGIED